MVKSDSDNLPLLSWLAMLSDVARVRVLRLLERQELSVGELSRALQLPQSTVSRHLKVLHEQNWIVKRSEGTASLYRLTENALDPAAAKLWRLTREQLGSAPTFDEDDHRLEGVLAERRTDSREFFGRVGGEWAALRRELFGEAFTAEALLNLVQSDWIIADLGCGTGDAAERLAPIVKKIIAVDREPAMIEAARKRLAGFSNIDFRRGELTQLPLKAGEVHAALMFLVLHHISDPQVALNEIARVLKPGGTAMIVDMVTHDREAYRHTMGHQHLGFERRQIEKWAKTAGLKLLAWRRLPPDTAGKGPGLFVATLRK